MGEMTMLCKICGNRSTRIFTATVLRKYEIAYFHCGQCGFLQTEEPYWLKEAYAESITLSDTGILERNIMFSKQVALLLEHAFDVNGTFVDYAGGYGIFTRLMRDIGFDYHWTDPFTKNLVARGFEFTPGSAPVEAMTSFETFEHLSDPLPEIERMLSISRNIIFSTQLLPDPVPAPDAWWYYVLEHGQHVSLYSRKTLENIAARYSLNYYTFGLLHLFTPKRLNVTKLKLMFRLQNYGIDRIFRKKLKSRTIADFERFSKGDRSKQ
jgi:hypothetical protein